MKKRFVAAAILAAALAQPAAAVTFSNLTTIYVITGVRNTGPFDNTGEATAFQCSNVSGVSTTIRVLILDAAGAVLGSGTASVAHGATTCSRRT